MNQEEKLIRILSARPNWRRDLEAVRSLGLPQWCIAAGYVRNYVWDHMHGRAEATPLNDIDVLYHDPEDPAEATEKRYEDLLNHMLPGSRWSVKNQARMHERNRERPYSSIEDAMKRWPETATATGISLDSDNRLVVIAPHGLDDLLGLTIRRSPFFRDPEFYRRRVESKRWLDSWPRLKFLED